jgi:hypothetical protein
MKLLNFNNLKVKTSITSRLKHGEQKKMMSPIADEKRMAGKWPENYGFFSPEKSEDKK